MSQEWNIRSRSRVCAVCEQPFEDKSNIYSVLRFGEEGYVRQDIGEGCWQKSCEEGAISFWRSVYEAPPPPSVEPLKKETVETLLRQYMSRDDYSQLEVIFILTVMLERKRVLVERDVQRKEDGMKIRLYEHRKTGEIFTVPDPELRLDQLAAVQEKVNELLGIGPQKSAPAQGEGEAPAEPEAAQENQSVKE